MKGSKRCGKREKEGEGKEKKAKAEEGKRIKGRKEGTTEGVGRKWRQEREK